MKSKDRVRSRAPGCLLILLVVLIALLGVLHFTAPILAKNAANKRLPEQLGTGASLDSVRMNLLTGSFGIDNLVVEQPEGFEGDPLLRLHSLDIDLPVGKAIRRDPLVIRDVHLDGLDLNLITDTNAVMNVTLLGPPPPEEPEPETDPAPPPPVWIQNLLLENIRVSLRDLALEWDLQVEDIRVQVENLRVAHGDPGDPAIIRLDLTLPDSRTPARLLVRAKVGPVHPDRPERIPAMQIAIGLFGFDLDLVDPFLVSGARTAIGGTGLEIQSFMQIHPGDSMAEQILSGESVLTTDGGHTLRGNTGGTLAEPDLPITSVLGNILGNQFGRVTKLGGNIAKGGIEAGKAAGKTVGEAAKGVGRTVGKFGGGILKTAKGVATLDGKAAKEGLKDSTSGTVGEAAKGISKTTGAAWSGLGDTLRTATGEVDKDRWWAEVADREKAFEEKTTAWFADNPFPPAPDAAPGDAGEEDQEEEDTPSSETDEREENGEPKTGHENENNEVEAQNVEDEEKKENGGEEE